MLNGDDDAADDDDDDFGDCGASLDLTLMVVLTAAVSSSRSPLKHIKCSMRC